MSLIAIVPSLAAAYSGSVDPQLATITINRDFSAVGVWRIPFVRNTADNQFYLPEYSAYGQAASTRYKLTKMQETYSKKQVFPVQVYDEVLGVPVNSADPNLVQLYDVTYTMTPYFKGPVAMYEFWMAGGPSRIDPSMQITFPSDWKIISLWPSEATTSANTIGIHYSPSHAQYEPIVVVFQTSAAGTVQQFGKYTVSGTYDEVQKIGAALALLGTLDDTMLTNVGIKTPDKVLIISDNLSTVGQIGFEAEAIAANPNIVVFNNQLTKSKTTEEIAETLAHEMMHLAMNQQTLFRGNGYRAPFLDEGIAVYFQTLMHKKIFTDVNKRILNEDLNRTHVISPTEAGVLYESSFDTAFDGGRNLGTGASYMHAGLVFGRFADTAGAPGFKKLFPDLAGAAANVYSSDDSDTVFNMLSSISGLSTAKLKFPGKTENDVAGIVGRISHPDNDENVSADVITAYIKTGIKHYFAAGGLQTSAVVTPSAVVPSAPTVVPTAVGKAGKITKNLNPGSKDPEVISLQTFLESKGFLTMPVGVTKGYFGQGTKAALIKYQKSAGIAQTGTVGPKTRAAINSANGF